MDMQRKWIKLLKEIAEAPTEELRSCPSELVEEVQNKLRKTISRPDDGQEHIVALGADEQVACALDKGTAPVCASGSGLNQSTATRAQPQPTAAQAQPQPTAAQAQPELTAAQATDTKHDLLQTILQKSKEISKFLKLDLQKIFQEGVQQQGVDPRIQDIARFAEKTKFDRLRCIFGCWTLFVDNKEWTRGKTSHECSVKNFTTFLGAPSRNVVTYGLSNGAKIDAYIKAFKGLAVMPLLPFIKWRQLDDHEVSAFAELCYDDKTIEDFLEAGAQVYAESENIFRMSLQRRGFGVQQVAAAKRTGPDVSEHHHGKSQRVSGSSSFLPNSTNPTAPAALQYYPPSPHFANGSNSTPIDAWNGETSTFSALDEYLSNSTVPIDGSLSGYPTVPIDSSLRVYSSEQLETPEQSLGFNHSLFSMVHPRNIPNKQSSLVMRYKKKTVHFWSYHEWAFEV
jgi:hypothetical protein